MDKNVYLRNPKLLFYITIFTSINSLAPIITLFYKNRSLSVLEITLLSSLIPIFSFILEIPIGYFADKYGRKFSLLIGNLFLVAYGIIYFFANSFFMFAVGMSFFAIAMAFFSGSNEALIYDSLKKVKKEKLASKYFGWYNSAGNFAPLFFAPVAALIARDLTNFQFDILLSINLLGYLIGIILTFFIVEPKFRHKGVRKGTIASFKDSFKLLLTNKNLINLGVNLYLLSPLIILWWAYFAQLYYTKLGINVVYFGFLASAATFFSIIIRTNTHRLEKYFGEINLLYLSSIIPMIAFILMVFIKNIWISLILVFVIAIASVRKTVFSTYINHNLESHNRATVLSAMAMIAAPFTIIIQIVLGYIADIGFNYLLLFMALWLFIITFVFRIKKEHITVKV